MKHCWLDLHCWVPVTRQAAMHEHTSAAVALAFNLRHHLPGTDTPSRHSELESTRTLTAVESMCRTHLLSVQAEALKLNKPLMVVGTPGRLTELSRLGRLQTHNCPMLVLDEVSMPP